ncbi:MAG TPA: cytochrome c [Anaerolineaceae bacterium]|nr:cytochrome c [Anaerolineaceae bacterium]
MIKRLAIVLGLLLLPLAVGLLLTYDVIKVDWVSGMEIQASYDTQEDPLPMPPRSVPVQGAMVIEGLASAVNPVEADAASLARGKALFETHCVLCHGTKGNGKGAFSGPLQGKPADLLSDDVKSLTDGAIFNVISDGVIDEHPTMPALRENLPTAQNRWDAVNYVRELQKAKE